MNKNEFNNAITKYENVSGNKLPKKLYDICKEIHENVQSGRTTYQYWIKYLENSMKGSK